MRDSVFWFLPREEIMVEHVSSIGRMRAVAYDHPTYLSVVVREADYIVEREIDVPDSHSELIALLNPDQFDKCPRWARAKLAAAVQYVENQR
ncbi:MAG TPA: hypothetical protein VJG64_01235 [Candidatus Paceibacterota bacterium]